jgi:hypothetical protein
MALVGGDAVPDKPVGGGWFDDGTDVVPPGTSGGFFGSLAPGSSVAGGSATGCGMLGAGFSAAGGGGAGAGVLVCVGAAGCAAVGAAGCAEVGAAGCAAPGAVGWAGGVVGWGDGVAGCADAGGADGCCVMLGLGCSGGLMVSPLVCTLPRRGGVTSTGIPDNAIIVCAVGSEGAEGEACATPAMTAPASTIEWSGSSVRFMLIDRCDGHASA